ncbi:unnamed protein product [Protopolystoma xenopodis]|uniref:Uncharacterized protein n=1 Tax=Protopolystoma xenopodis TaxID=117903 RepID=A0A448XLH4_9PLAT|nr:unnamed protein product [Protopolystoma xenopodis]
MRSNRLTQPDYAFSTGNSCPAGSRPDVGQLLADFGLMPNKGTILLLPHQPSYAPAINCLQTVFIRLCSHATLTKVPFIVGSFGDAVFSPRLWYRERSRVRPPKAHSYASARLPSAELIRTLVARATRFPLSRSAADTPTLGTTLRHTRPLLPRRRGLLSSRCVTCLYRVPVSLAYDLGHLSSSSSPPRPIRSSFFRVSGIRLFPLSTTLATRPVGPCRRCPGSPGYASAGRTLTLFRPVQLMVLPVLLPSSVRRPYSRLHNPLSGVSHLFVTPRRPSSARSSVPVLSDLSNVSELPSPIGQIDVAMPSSVLPVDLEVLP